MYLKSLEMQGFKSFPDRTKVEFHHGTTVIVGPNGSGKSNITDAMRWVLGEISSKNIRGSKMEDVVFAGADGRNPMGYAEVSVTFDNTDETAKINVPYDEVTVTRRYYRAGESEYFINRRSVRLKDIHELFMNTGIGREGYSIIGQGRIAEIISRKSEDRRAVFEEAAGISKFRHKRQEAERSLAASEENMLRVNDILTEIEGRVGPLEKEAEKARRYLELYERKRRADISLAIFDSRRIRAEQKEAEDAYILSTHELEIITDTVAQLESQSERISEAFQDNKLSSERAYERIRTLTAALRTLDVENQAMTTDSTSSAAQAEDCRRSAEETKAQIAAAADDEKAVAARLEAIKKSFAEKEAALEEKRSALAEADRRLSEYARRLDELLPLQKAREDEVVDIKIRINVLRGSMENDAAKNISVSDEIAKHREQAELSRKKAEDERKTADDYAKAIRNSDKIISELSDEVSEYDLKISKLTEAGSAVRADIEALRHRIDALVRLEENFEGYGKSVKYVMDGAASGAVSGRVHGPVSRVINVSNEYITAIETALGANLQNIIVDSEETAKSAIYYLKKGGAGRATFYPITAIRGQEPGRELRDAALKPGYIGIASELVKCGGEYREIIKYLLGRTCVFDNIDNAASAAKASGYKIRAVTLDGQQINAGGSFTGGSAKRDSGMLSRAGEIKSLRAEAALREREAEATAAEYKSAAEVRAEHKNKLAGERSRRDMMDAMMRAAMSACDTAEAKYNATETLIEQLRSDYDTRIMQNERSVNDIAELNDKCAAAEAEAKRIRDERASLDTERHAAADERERISSVVSDALLHIAEERAEAAAVEELLFEKTRRRGEYEAQLAAFLQKAEELTKRAGEALQKQSENRKKYSEAENELASIEDERGRLESGGMEFERKQTELRRKIRERTDEKETAVRTHMKNEQRKLQLTESIDKLASHLWEEYELTFTAAAELDYPQVTPETRRGVSSELNECKSKLKALGNVNVGAVDEYNEVKERYEYLSRQMKDLTAAKADLEKIIAELNADMERSFSDAFARINERFGDVFRELFGGGAAELYLSDPTDVLASGIEIKAAPPGKIIKNMSLLSGGEQAFVAIALLFAMIHVNPTPFCIFDEIESALDEVNVDRFAAYVKRYSDQMQFVIITHRRGTMETADSLYGITMPKRGISRVLTLDTGDVEAKSRYTLDAGAGA